jgi:hypothetical protein
MQERHRSRSRVPRTRGAGRRAPGGAHGGPRPRSGERGYRREPFLSSGLARSGRWVPRGWWSASWQESGVSRTERCGKREASSWTARVRPALRCSARGRAWKRWGRARPVRSSNQDRRYTMLTAKEGVRHAHHVGIALRRRRRTRVCPAAGRPGQRRSRRCHDPPGRQHRRRRAGRRERLRRQGRTGRRAGNAGRSVGRPADRLHDRHTGRSPHAELGARARLIFSPPGCRLNARFCRKGARGPLRHAGLVARPRLLHVTGGLRGPSEMRHGYGSLGRCIGCPISRGCRDSPGQERRGCQPTCSLARECGRGVMSRVSPPHRAFHRAGSVRAYPVTLGHAGASKRVP